MKQQIIKFKLPKEAVVYPSDLRESVARHLNSPNQETLFHYKNGQGDSSYPLHRFVGGSGWVGYISEGDVSVAESMLVPGIKSLNESGVNASVEIVDQVKTCCITDEPIIYAINGGIDKRKDPKRRNLEDAEYIEHMIWRMLENAVLQNVLDILPTEDELGIRVLETRSVGIPAGHRRGEGKLHYHKVSGQFAMNMSLSGFWQAGQLLSRGYGSIYRQNKGGYFVC